MAGALPYALGYPDMLSRTQVNMGKLSRVQLDMYVVDALDQISAAG